MCRKSPWTFTTFQEVDTGRVYRCHPGFTGSTCTCGHVCTSVCSPIVGSGNYHQNPETQLSHHKEAPQPRPAPHRFIAPCEWNHSTQPPRRASFTQCVSPETPRCWGPHSLTLLTAQ